MPNPKITKIENISFAHQIENMGTDYNGFNQVYQKGATLTLTPCVVRIHTSIGVTGECLGPPVPENVARYLLGRNPFARERIYNDLKRGLRHSARTDICAVDVALWDFAGKVYNAPIWQLLGGWRKTIPAYASTYHGDENGGLSTPEAFADFAEQCAEIGYPAFKIHGWGNAPIAREVANVLAVGKRVGERMDLMIDPACEYETWADALARGPRLRRGRLLLARRPLSGRRRLHLRPQEATRVAQDAAFADRAHLWSRTARGFHRPRRHGFRPRRHV